jgi:deoxyhypusine synthase
MKKTLGDAKRSIFRKSEDIEGIEVRGYDFDRGVNFEEMLEGYRSSGFQAHNLSRAIDIIRKMRKGKARIFLGYTSNMVTSGNRELIRYLVKHRLVHVLVTSTGGVEEDFIKTMKPFIMGRFRADGAGLRRRGINRAGNIFIPNDRYIEFENFFQPVLGHFMRKQEETGKIAVPSEIINHMGSIIKDESSIYYWAHRNRIPVFCPGFMDGAVGDNVYFFNYQKGNDLKIDMARDHRNLIEMAMEASETGVIIMGAGIVKHTICNVNMMREGAKYAVYINTAPEYDGSDSGAMPDEAKSWGKLTADANTVKVFGDLTIIFPLIVAGAFVDRK